jgi:hypothetical protein
MDHVHGPNCGCQEVAKSEEADDLLGSINIDQVCKIFKRQKNKKKFFFY